MAIAFDNSFDLARRVDRPAMRKQPAESAPVGGRVSDILQKHDDRLIRDIGLTREDLEGPTRTFWREWLKKKAPWRL